MNDDPAIIDVELQLKTDMKSVDDYVRQIQSTLKKAKIFEAGSGDSEIRKTVENNVKYLDTLRTSFIETYRQIAADMNRFSETRGLEGRIDSITRKLSRFNEELKKGESDFGKSGNNIALTNKDIVASEQKILDIKKQISKLNRDRQRDERNINKEYEKGSLTEKQAEREKAKIKSSYANKKAELDSDLSSEKNRLSRLKKNNDEERLRNKEIYNENQNLREQIGVLEAGKAKLEAIKNDEAERLKYNQAISAEMEKQFRSRVDNLGKRKENMANLVRTTENDFVERKREYFDEERRKRAEEQRKEQEQITNEIERQTKAIGRQVRSIMSEGDATVRVEEEKRRATQQRIAQLTRERSEIKQEAAQWYYVLRALKMLKYALDNINKGIDNFIKKSIQGVDKTTKRWWKLANIFLTIPKAIGKAAKSMNDLKKKSDSAKKSHDGLVDSFKRGFLTVLKYAFGIRSMFFLFNRLRRALATGMENLATQYSHVNDQMSSVVSSLERMKNAVAAMVQPLLNILVPALEKLSEAFSKLSYNVASFFAALTGQDFVYFAKKVKKGYIEDKKAAKDYNDEVDRQLSNLDKLNVLTSPKDNKKDEETPVTDMFDIVPLEGKFKDLIKKIKDFLKPIFDAWKKEAEFVKNAWKYAIREVGKLLKDMWRDFKKVWFQDATQRIFENIFHVVGDIGLIIGNIAKNLRIAWNENQNGYRILMGIRDIILIITEGIRDAADYTVEWSEKLNFTPLLTAIADVLLLQIVPAVQKVVDLLVQLYKDVVLELVRYFIEDFGPIMVKAFGNIIEAIGNLADRFLTAWNDMNRGKNIIYAIEDIFNDIGDTILDITEQTKEWAASIDFGSALDAIEGTIRALRKPIKFIIKMVGKFWTDVILPFWKNFIEKGLPKLKETVERIVNRMDWNKLESLVTKIFEVISLFMEKYGDFLLSLIEQIANAIITLVNSGTLESIVDFVGKLIESIDVKELANWALTIGTIVLALRPITGILAKVVGLLISVFSILNFIKQFQALFAIKNLTREIKGLQDALTGTEAAARNAGTAVANGAKSATSTATAAGMSLGQAIFFGVTSYIAGHEIGNAIGSWLFPDDKELYEKYSGIKGIFTEMKDFAVAVYDFVDMKFEAAHKKLAEQSKTQTVNQNKVTKTVEETADKMTVLDNNAKSVSNTMNNMTTNGAIENLNSDLPVTIVLFDDTNTSIGNVSKTLSTDIPQSSSIAAQSIKDNMSITTTTFDETSKAVDGVKDSLSSIPESELLASNAFKDLDSVMKETANTAETAGIDTATGYSNGFSSAWDEYAIPAAEEKSESFWQKIKNFFHIGSPSKLMEDLGRNVVLGLAQGIISTWASALSNSVIGNLCRNIINSVKSILSPTTLVNVGKNLITGLANGLISSMNKALDAIRRIANSIINTARRAFQVHSPSKVFEEIGEFITEGLAVGVEEDTDQVTDAFEDLVPNSEFLDIFYEKFITMLSNLRLESVSIVTAMIDDIESIVARIDNLAMLDSISNQLANVSKIEVPDIALGYKLPENEKFSQTETVDMSQLPKMLKNAFIEAFSETDALQNGNGDTIITIDGNEIFRVTKRENDKYRKQNGVSAFA